MKRYLTPFLFLLLILSLQTSLYAQEPPTDLNNTAVVSEIQEEPEEEFDDDFGDDFDDFEEEEEELKDDTFDPLSGYNRFMTSFNKGLYTYFLNPVLIKPYKFILPKPVQVSINNFFFNLYYPVSAVNTVLQLKFKATATETGRFAINSTLGILGLFDPAEKWFGIEAHVEDFGQTLGHYGVGSGFHIVLPFFGPTNLRDLSGDFLDFYVNPIYYVDVRKYNLVQNTYQSWAVIGYKEFNDLAVFNKEYQSMLDDAVDLYLYQRETYEQNRIKDIEE